MSRMPCSTPVSAAWNARRRSCSLVALASSEFDMFMPTTASSVRMTSRMRPITNAMPRCLRGRKCIDDFHSASIAEVDGARHEDAPVMIVGRGRERGARGGRGAGGGEALLRILGAHAHPEAHGRHLAGTHDGIVGGDVAVGQAAHVI